MIEKRGKLLTISLIAVSMVLALIQVVILNLDSTHGERQSILSKKIETLEAENNKLTQKIASSSALSNLSIKAKERGFILSANIVSLGAPVPLALSERSSL